MTESKIKENKDIRQNTGAILNPAACGASPTRNFLSVGFAAKGICEYIEPTGEPEVPNVAPIVDLNGASGGVNAAYSYTEGDEASLVVPSALVSDLDGLVIESITIVGASGFGLDGADDIVEFGAEQYPSNANKTANVTFGGTSCAIAYTTATKTFVISKAGGGDIPKADAQLAVRGFTYNNTATPPDTTDRVFTFVVNDGEDDSTPAVLTVTVAAAAETFFRLRESGDRQLRETGDYQLLETEA